VLAVPHKSVGLTGASGHKPLTKGEEHGTGGSEQVVYNSTTRSKTISNRGTITRTNGTVITLITPVNIIKPITGTISVRM
jgi:hypothetical protein